MSFKKMTAVAVLCVAGLAIIVIGGCKEEKPTAMSGHSEHASQMGHENHAGHAMAQFANTKCPIMGSTITPEKVTADLTREFKGDKVAFCCAGCPDKWDALSEEQKTAKLAAAK